ncbi:MAG: arsenic efflux protein [Gammaproteobacteria bacterium]|nr:arsenic efflux protein [Gammaproteobacteria bacterium]
MTVLVQGIRQIGAEFETGQVRVLRRLAPLLMLFALISVVPDGWAVALDALSEAYLAVSVFVAGTLALVYTIERGFNADLGAWLMRYRRWQVPAGALLGAFPGCGGAIVAMTQYTRGYLSFGGVVATLTATMGDAMFLLLASEPVTGIGVLAMGVIVGALSGYIVDAVHGQAFLRPEPAAAGPADCSGKAVSGYRWSGVEKSWIGLMIPGVVIGLSAAFRMDVDALIAPMIPGNPGYWIGVAGALLAVAMWVGADTGGESPTGTVGATCGTQYRPVSRRVIDDTNFITTWVVFAFVGYELVVATFGLDLGAALTVWTPLVPAMAIVIGLIPGCGPQILVTSLYVSGAVPLSAQLGNAVANDGDALFPAIAVAPKAALLATVYSAVPAFLVAYGWYFLFE